MLIANKEKISLLICVSWISKKGLKIITSKEKKMTLLFIWNFLKTLEIRKIEVAIKFEETNKEKSSGLLTPKKL